MFVPFLTTPTPNRKSRRSIANPPRPHLDRRKGGGGGGKATGGGGEGSTGGSSGSSGGSTGGTTSVPLSGGTTASGKTTASAYGSGGGSIVTIPSGQLFAGRSEGGGTRGEVFGTTTYGSGYPGITGFGVAGRGFPFWFWPVVWGPGNGIYVGTYLDGTEYGDSFNTSRLGGPMMQATFVSSANTNTTTTTNTTTNTTMSSTFHVLSDNSTLTSLIASISTTCSSSLSPSLSSNTSNAPAHPFNASDPNAPQPFQAIQYFRASSIVLTLDGYNNSAVTALMSSRGNTTVMPQDSPLPPGVDMTLLGCLNQTIGLATPLVDGAASTRWSTGMTTTMGGMWGVGFVWWVVFSGFWGLI